MLPVLTNFGSFRSNWTRACSVLADGDASFLRASAAWDSR